MHHTLRISLRSWRLCGSIFSLGCFAGCSEPLVGTFDELSALIFNVDADPTRPVAFDKPLLNAKSIFDAVAGKSESHAPTVTAFADGELLAAWYSYTGPHELTGSAIFLSRRAAGQTEWTPPELHIDRERGDGNPVLFSEGDHVWLFQAVVAGGWSTSRIVWQESPDRGHTWSPPREIDGPLGSNVRFAPLRTADGELLLPAYDDLLNRALFFAWDGHAWRLRSAIWMGFFSPSIQPAVVRLADGELLAVMRNADRRWLWASSSHDAGRTWTTPIDAGFPNDDASTALVRLKNGRLVMAWNAPEEPGHPLYATLSADEGRTWLPLKVLASGPGTYSYPTIVEGPDGVIHIVYSDDRRRIGHIEINEAFLIQSEPQAQARGYLHE